MRGEADKMIGRSFGSLKVLRIARRDKWRKPIYECVCLEMVNGRECGNLHKVPASDLRSGNTKRCFECFKRNRSIKSTAYRNWIFNRSKSPNAA